MLNREISLDLQHLFSIKLLTGTCSESVSRTGDGLKSLRRHSACSRWHPQGYRRKKTNHVGLLSAAICALLELGNENFSHPSPMTVLKTPQSIFSHSSPLLLYIGCFAPKAPQLHALWHLHFKMPDCGVLPIPAIDLVPQTSLIIQGQPLSVSSCPGSSSYGE